MSRSICHSQRPFLVAALLGLVPLAGLAPSAHAASTGAASPPQTTSVGVTATASSTA